MEIVDNRAVLLNTKTPNKITASIPKSKKVAENKVLVNWGVEETRVLRNLNFSKVPSPIMGQYGWPSKYKPFDHQKTTAAFLTLNPRAFCFNEQGTGKTASAIWASDFLLKKGAIKRVLVICPLSIMDSAWRGDLFTFAMHRKVDIAYGVKEQRKKVIESDAEYIIINYDGIEVVSDAIAAGGFDLIIIDEANHYKNPNTKRWKTLAKIITPNKWVWMMTGTPAAQSPVDAFGLAKLINPSKVPRYMGAFREMVMYKVTPFKWAPRPSATDIVHNALQPAIRFTKEQCLDLPPMVYVKREVELNRIQKQYYEKLRKHMLMTAAGEEVSAVNAAVVMNKLLQISCGAVYSDTGEVVEFDIRNRYRVLLEVIEESSKKVLVFVPYKHTIDVLQERLDKDNITNAIIRGDVSAGNRTRIFERFQSSSDPRVLLIQPQSAAHGVTLTAANTVVWWGPTPSLETYAQANARVHRSGQTERCTVVQLQGSPVERKMYSILDQRIDVHSKMTNLYKEMLEPQT